MVIYCIPNERVGFFFFFFFFRFQIYIKVLANHLRQFPSFSITLLRRCFDIYPYVCEGDFIGVVMR